MQGNKILLLKMLLPRICHFASFAFNGIPNVYEEVPPGN